MSYFSPVLHRAYDFHRTRRSIKQIFKKEWYVMPKKVTTKDFIARAQKVHGNKYDYSKAHYINAKTKLTIICPIHGPFQQDPSNHLAGKGCPICAGNKPNTTQTFIDKAKKVHGNKYDYSQVHFTKNNQKVKIICPKHGPFWQEANSHLQGHGCPQCKAEAMRNVKHPERGEQIRQGTLAKYGVKNVMQVPELLSKNEQAKITNRSYHASKPENKAYELLVNYFGKDDVIRQHKDLKRYPFLCDFYIKSKDAFIELNIHWTHGHHWFNGSPEDLETIKYWLNKNKPSYNTGTINFTIRDVKKRTCAATHNLNYVVFWKPTLRDLKLWLQNGAPDAHDYDHEYSWLPQNKNVHSFLSKY